MRSTLTLLLCLALCAAALTSSGCHGRRTRARAVPETKLAVKAEDPGATIKEFQGWGLNQQEAETKALEKASEFFKEFLARQNPPLTVAPSPAYIRRHLVHEPAERRE